MIGSVGQKRVLVKKKPVEDAPEQMPAPAPQAETAKHVKIWVTCKNKAMRRFGKRMKALTT